MGLGSVEPRPLFCPGTIRAWRLASRSSRTQEGACRYRCRCDRRRCSALGQPDKARVKRSTGLSAAAATATILPIHLLPPAGRAGSVGLRQMRPAVSVRPRAAIVPTMPNAMAPPAIAVGHRIEVGLRTGRRCEMTCCAAHAGLRGKRAAGKRHRAHCRTNQELQGHENLLVEFENAALKRRFPAGVALFGRGLGAAIAMVAAGMGVAAGQRGQAPVSKIAEQATEAIHAIHDAVGAQGMPVGGGIDGDDRLAEPSFRRRREPHHR